MCMEEALHWKQCCKYSALGILLSTCFLIQEYFITPHMLRLRRWVFHFYPLLFISWSRINAVNARLWDGTRRLFELLKPCVGLMVVPRHERAGMCEIKERAHAETWWCILGFYFTWRDVSQSCGFGERVCGEQWWQIKYECLLHSKDIHMWKTLSGFYT